MKPRTLRLLCITLGALAVATSVSAEVELEAEQRENLGIETEPAQSIEAPRTWPASAQVLDISPLVTSLGDLHSAETAAAASRAEAERSERLYKDDTNIARKALDAARAQAVADETRVRAARAQLGGAWGRSIVTMSPAARTKLVDDLLEGRASLVRADQTVAMPRDLPAPAVHVSSLNGAEEWPAEWLGVLPQTTNATLAGASLLRVAVSLPVGQLLRATLAEKQASLKGLSVPPSAIIRWHGSQWMYEEVSPNHFERREVRSGARVAARVLITSFDEAPTKEAAGTAPHVAPKVVIVGARALLGAELGASAPEDAAEASD